MIDRAKVLQSLEHCISDEHPCVDCPYKEKCIREGWIVALQKDVLELLQEQPQWVSVKDRLPKVYNAYLAVVNGEVEEVIFCPTSMKRQRWSHCIAEGFEFLEDDSVTHWMPMPKPPEVKQDG